MGSKFQNSREISESKSDIDDGPNNQEFEAAQNSENAGLQKADLLQTLCNELSKMEANISNNGPILAKNSSKMCQIKN